MSTTRIVSGLLLALLGIAGRAQPAAAQDTTRVSVDSSGAEGDLASGTGGIAISADSRFVAFGSDADNLVAGDTNQSSDIFVHDRTTGIIERVSVDSSGGQADGTSFWPSISSDGRFVAFASDADNLVAGDTNRWSDIFVHDRSTGVTERVSVDSSGGEGNGMSGEEGVAISADGKIVAFESLAWNLVAGGAPQGEIYVHDRSTGITEIVSVDGSGVAANIPCRGPSISADGSVIAFSTAADNLVPGDTNYDDDDFIHDRSTGVTERVSVDSSGAEANGGSFLPFISADGQFVTFASLASNLVPGVGLGNVYVHERSTGLTECVSVDSSGVPGNMQSLSSSISADGKIVAFFSGADNLVAGDTNHHTDVFVHDRTTGSTQRVSVKSNGNQVFKECFLGSITADGNVVVFVSEAAGLVQNDKNGVMDVFVFERCSSAATWSNYGAGFPGTNGVPSFTSRQFPALGSTVTVDVANSLGSPTVGLLFVGFQRTTIHSNLGGDLLVVPAFVIPISFSFGSDSFTGALPTDWSLCGTAIDLQAVEADAGAAKGVSFTAALELVLGR
jgi:Tol biopolymer transport system component